MSNLKMHTFAKHKHILWSVQICEIKPCTHHFSIIPFSRVPIMLHGIGCNYWVDTLHLEFSFVFASLYGISSPRQQTRNITHWKVKNKITSIQWNNICTEVILYNVRVQLDLSLSLSLSLSPPTPYRNLLKLLVDPPMQLTRKAQYWQFLLADLDEGGWYQTEGRHILDNSIVKLRFVFY